MSVKVTVASPELKELRLRLRKIDRALGKEFRQIWLEAARLVEPAARAAAPGTSARSITGRATQRAAMIRITARRGDELARFFGARRRSGWYAAGRYAQSAGRQFRPWVGNQWDPGERAASPWFIGDAINDSADRVEDLIGDRLAKLLDWTSNAP